MNGSLRLRPGLLAAAAAMAPIGVTLAVPHVMPARAYLTFVWAPAIVVFLGVLRYTARHDRGLFNRLVTGLWAGVLATAALDVFRLAGVAAHIIPMDEAMGLAQLVMGMAGHGDHGGGHSAGHDSGHVASLLMGLIGYLWHYSNGAGMAVAFTAVAGGRHWLAGVLWGSLIWTGMWVSPFMVGMAGFFAVKMGPSALGLNLVTLMAHLAYGAVLGHLAQRFVQEKTWLLPSPGPQGSKGCNECD